MAAIDESYEVRGILTEDSQYIQIPAYKVYQRAFRKFQGKELVVSVKVLRYKRSSAQNKFCWGVIVPTVRHWLWETQGENFTNDEVYLWLRISLLGEKPKVVVIAGQEIITTSAKRFSAMNTKEFATAVDTIINKMAEKGCTIPEPKKKSHHFVDEYIVDE